MAKGLGSSLISFVALAMFVASLGATGYYYVQYRGFDQKIKVLKESQSKAQGALDDFKAQEQIYPKIRAYRLIQRAEDIRVKWSEVMEDILAYQSFSLKFNSFSSDKDKLISIRGWVRRMEDVALLLEELKRDPKIETPFISTVAENNDGRTGVGYAFNLTFFYQDLDQ